MQTTVTIDFGVIVTALAPTLAIIIAYFLARRDAQAVKDEALDKLDGVHALVNDALTREKDARLVLLKSNKVLVETTLSKGATKKNQEHISLLSTISAQIAALESEIQKRDAVAASLTKEQK